MIGHERFWKGAVVLAALAVVALIPLWSAYGSAAYWVAGVGGVLVGVLVAAVSHRFRWRVLTQVIVALAAYLVFGGALALRATTIAVVLPTVPTVSGLLLGIVQSWKQLLTVPTPISGLDTVLVVPYLCGLVAGVAGPALAARFRFVGWSVIPASAVLVTSIVFSTFAPVVPIAVGTVFALVALLWVVTASPAGTSGRGANLADRTASERRVGSRRRIRGAAIVVLGGVVAGVAVAGATPPSTTRAVLRDAVTPPLDVYDYTSPLESFRKDVGTSAKTDLFTVKGLPAGARIRLAALDQYDGIVYKVSGNGSTGSGTFTRVGDVLVADPTTVAPASKPVSVTFTLRSLSSNWLPDVGFATSLGFEGSAGTVDDQTLHYDAATGTALSTTALASGSTYTEHGVVPSAPSPADLAKASIAPVSTPAPQNDPDSIAAAVTTATKGATTPIARVEAIKTWLSTTGYFSHGLAGQVTSRSGHTSERIAALLGGQQMIGDDEQYSVTMALMVAHLGIPVRVVMGFIPKSTDAGTVTITGSDVHAWVEVPLSGLGWVAFDPTPSAARVPHQQTPLPQSKPQAEVPQPPPAVQDPANLPPAPPVHQTPKTKKRADLTSLWGAVRIGGISCAVLLVLLGPSIALGLIQARRRRWRLGRGSAPDRMHGSWSELVDAAADLGTPPASGSTRREDAAALGEAFPGLPITVLARRADDAVFGPATPTPQEVDAYRTEVDQLVTGIRRRAGFRRRLTARIAPRSVLRDLRTHRKESER